MYFLSHPLHIYYISIFIRLMDAYVLFAANLEDFHALAKLVPQTFDDFNRMVSKASVREKKESSDIEDNSYEAELESSNLPPIRGNKEKPVPIKDKKESHKTKETLHLNGGTKVDFDELVDKVKKRLTLELKRTYLDKMRKGAVNFHEKIKENIGKLSKNIQHNDNVATTKNEDTNKVNDQFDTEEMSPFVDTPDYKEDVFNKPKLKQGNDDEDAAALSTNDANPAKDDYNPYINNVRLIKKTTPSKLYKKMAMTQTDSYEDYLTPSKDTTVFTSKETKQDNIENASEPISNHKRYKIKSNRLLYHKNMDSKYESTDKNEINEENKSFTTPSKYDYTDRVVESGEIKAKTENLWHVKNYDKMITDDTIILTESSKDPNLGTRLPRRHTYKMATPNYLANLPVVVEKYNFNEPIPDRDRDRENLKYIGNPPASINKKIHLRNSRTL